MYGQMLNFDFGIMFVLLAIWSLYWKGQSLWRAARQGQSNWFIALLVLNIGYHLFIYDQF